MVEHKREDPAKSINLRPNQTTCGQIVRPQQRLPPAMPVGGRNWLSF